MRELVLENRKRGLRIFFLNLTILTSNKIWLFFHWNSKYVSCLEEEYITFVPLGYTLKDHPLVETQGSGCCTHSWVLKLKSGKGLSVGSGQTQRDAHMTTHNKPNQPRQGWKQVSNASCIGFLCPGFLFHGGFKATQLEQPCSAWST